MTCPCKLLLLFLVYARSTNAFCPRDGVSGANPGSCYFAVPSMGYVSFGTGRSYCSEFYGHMASVTNVFDNRVILELAQRTFPSGTTIWLGAIWDGHTVTWADGSPDVYRNFQKPDTPPPSGDLYMDIDTGRWSTATGSITKPFVCGMYDDAANISATCPTGPFYPPCPDDYFYSSALKNCYKGLYTVVHDTAEAECQKDGAHLASIHSLEENTLLNQMFKMGEPTCTQTLYPIIGGHRTGPGKNDWEWVDGTPFDYTNWALAQPDNNQGIEYCIVMFSDRETADVDLDHWNDYKCDHTQRVAICKIPAKY